MCDKESERHAQDAPNPRLDIYCRRVQVRMPRGFRFDWIPDDRCCAFNVDEVAVSRQVDSIACK